MEVSEPGSSLPLSYSGPYRNRVWCMAASLPSVTDPRGLPPVWLSLHSRYHTLSYQACSRAVVEALLI